MPTHGSGTPTTRLGLPTVLPGDAPDGPTQINDVATGLDAIATQRKKSIIATSESRTNTAYGTLTTPDQVTVIMPTDGLITVKFQAMWQESVSGAARAAIFIGANQLAIQADQVAGSPNPGPQAQAAAMGNAAGHDRPLFSFPGGLASGLSNSTPTADVTTGQAVGYAGISSAPTQELGGVVISAAAAGTVLGGAVEIEAAAGTYVVSIKFKASSGSVTVNHRKMWVASEVYS